MDGWVGEMVFSFSFSYPRRVLFDFVLDTLERECYLLVVSQMHSFADA